MQARDFRSIGRAAQEELRRRALFLIEQQGLSQGQAARMVGVHRQTVNIWLKRYRQQGAQPRERGLGDAGEVHGQRPAAQVLADYRVIRDRDHERAVTGRLGHHPGVRGTGWAIRPLSY